jgi:hypothetical protein
MCGVTMRCQSRAGMEVSYGRDDWIRTSGLTHPKGARYQAAPRPERTSSVSLAFEKGQDRPQFLADVP